MVIRPQGELNTYRRFWSDMLEGTLHQHHHQEMRHNLLEEWRFTSSAFAVTRFRGSITRIKVILVAHGGPISY